DGYGVIGLPRSTKNGINTFLSGYLPEENVRFRKNKVEFTKREQKDASIKQKLTEWTEIKKDLGSFKLDAKKGSVYENETIGILGPNGIGKTTFIKILAGVLKSDVGEVETKIKVSYKPQYIDTQSEKTVFELFAHEWEDIFFDMHIKKPLHIDKIKHHKVCELSGGQLQRVAIADCLTKKCDLYLLDEPSAYLDIEQRLEISKIIRNVMEVHRKTAIVVDHDLLFLDYISDKLIVFEGIPAIHGSSFGPVSMNEGMTHFLKDIGVTFRRDDETLRPRTNKENSQLDKIQKSENKYYYT
ncbi:MAG: ATP-binding cassette domain-containing protein, partial [Candidatus Woesearchaeota archaeon]